VGGLDEVAVTGDGGAVLVDDRALRCPPPRPQVLVVEARDHRDRVQPQVAADGGAADPGPQQDRGRLERAGGDDHRGRTDRHGPACPGVEQQLGLDPDRPAVLDEDPTRLGSADDACVRVGGVAEVGPQRPLLRAGAVAVPDVPGGLGRVAVAGSTLRTAGRQLHPRASAASARCWFTPLRSVQAAVAEIRSSTASR
jgi:hypothetical protein